MKKIRGGFKKAFFLLVLAGFWTFFLTNRAQAIYDPTTTPNNIFGIHILSVDEIEQAAALVNSSGGAWGYVTIPIQYNDRNLEKWQKFMDKSLDLKVVPIVRIATEEYFKTPGVWRKPNKYDLVDFANFLDSLKWPTQNRYVILFNEVNRFDEWEGKAPNPEEYAGLVIFAQEVFKKRNQDFFLILSGLDNGAASNYSKYLNEYEFLARLRAFDLGIFDNIDGIASHSYPNPGFSASPNASARMGVSSFKYEYDYVNRFTKSKKPVFITETGWDSHVISDETVSYYFKKSFLEIWNDSKVAAVTPFLLNSQNGPFDKFSFLKNGAKSQYYQEIEKIAKVKGEPELLNDRLNLSQVAILGEKTFNNNNLADKKEEIDLVKNKLFKAYLKLILGI